MNQISNNCEIKKYEGLAESGKDENILSLWKFYSNSLPILSKVARIILAIPASSAKSERVFSASGNHITALRSSLHPEKVEDLVVVYTNLELLEEYENIGKK